MHPDHLPPALQTVIARVVKAERRRAHKQAEYARREVYAALGEVLVKSLPGVFLKAAEHAPAGGIKVQGKEYKGGEFIPSDVMDRATEEERAAVRGGGKTEDDGSDKKETVKSDLSPDEARDRLTTAWHPAEKAEPKLNAAWNSRGDPGENVTKVVSEPLAMVMDYVAQMEKAVRAAGGSAAESRGLRSAVADQMKAIKAAGGRAEKAAKKVSELDAEEKTIEAELAAIEVEPEEPDYDAILNNEMPEPGEPDYDAVLDEEFPEVDVDVDATLDEEFPEPDEPDQVTADDYDGSEDPEPDEPDEVDAADAPDGTDDPDDWADAENARRRAEYDAAHEAWSSRPDDWAAAENARRRSEHQAGVRKVGKAREGRRVELEEKAAEKTANARQQRREAMESEHAARVAEWESAREKRKTELEGDYEKVVKEWEKDATKKRAKLEKRIGVLADQYGDSRDEVEEAFSEFADGYGDVLMAVSDYIAELDHLHKGPVTKSITTPARLTREAKSLGLSLQLADLKEGVRRGVAADVWLWNDLIAACEDEWATERYTKADRSHLVRKVIRNRLGNRQVIWVNPNKAGAKDDAGKGVPVGEDGKPVKEEPKPLTREQVNEARTIIAQAVADPNKLNPEQLKDLGRHVDAITKEEARGLLKTMGAKLSGDQKAVAERLVAAVRAGREQGKGVGDALRAAGNKTSGQYGAWGAAAGGGAKPVSRDEFPKRGQTADEREGAEQEKRAADVASRPEKNTDRDTEFTIPTELGGRKIVARFNADGSERIENQGNTRVITRNENGALITEAIDRKTGRQLDASYFRGNREAMKTHSPGEFPVDMAGIPDNKQAEYKERYANARNAGEARAVAKEAVAERDSISAEKLKQSEKEDATAKRTKKEEVASASGYQPIAPQSAIDTLRKTGLPVYQAAQPRSGVPAKSGIKVQQIPGKKTWLSVEYKHEGEGDFNYEANAEKMRADLEAAGYEIQPNRGDPTILTIRKPTDRTPTITPAEFDRRMESIDPRDSGRVEVPEPVRPLEADDADKERYDAAVERLDRMRDWAADRPDDLRAEEQVRRAEARVREAELPDVPERREPAARAAPGGPRPVSELTDAEIEAERRALPRNRRTPAQAERDRELTRENARRNPIPPGGGTPFPLMGGGLGVGNNDRSDERTAQQQPAAPRVNYQTLRKQAAEGMAAGAAAMQQPHDGSGLPDIPLYAPLSPDQRADLDAQHRAAKTRQDARGVELRAQRMAMEAESARRSDAARDKK